MLGFIWTAGNISPWLRSSRRGDLTCDERDPDAPGTISALSPHPLMQHPKKKKKTNESLRHLLLWRHLGYLEHLVTRNSSRIRFQRQRVKSQKRVTTGGSPRKSHRFVERRKPQSMHGGDPDKQKRTGSYACHH